LSAIRHGLLITLLAVTGTRGGLAQEHQAQWVSWNLPVRSVNYRDLPAVKIPDTVRVHEGYQHWRGAGLGAAIGGALGALTGAIAGAITSCYDCSQQPSAGSGALLVGLVGAGAGGVLGFLAGLASPRYVWIPTDEARAEPD
jgi:hypothetical protein